MAWNRLVLGAGIGSGWIIARRIEADAGGLPEVSAVGKANATRLVTLPADYSRTTINIR
jgi:hypothetical protein